MFLFVFTNNSNFSLLTCPVAALTVCCLLRWFWRRVWRKPCSRRTHCSLWPCSLQHQQPEHRPAPSHTSRQSRHTAAHGHVPSPAATHHSPTARTGEATRTRNNGKLPSGLQKTISRPDLQNFYTNQSKMFRSFIEVSVVRKERVSPNATHATYATHYTTNATQRTQLTQRNSSYHCS